jgi:hypothetical protein
MYFNKESCGVEGRCRIGMLALLLANRLQLLSDITTEDEF